MKDLDDATKEQVPSSHLPSEETAGIGALDEDPNYERRLVRKLDLHIIPLVMALYLFSFLDRCVIHVQSYKLMLNGPVESILGPRGTIPCTAIASHSA